MKISDILTEFKIAPQKDKDYEVLTLTEKNGFVKQSDRFNKRLATENISKYKVIEKGDMAFNPYLLWAGAIALNINFEVGIISPLYPTFKVDNCIDSSYLYSILLSPQMIRKFDQISFGSVPRKRRSTVKDFLQLTLPPLPPLGEQKRIAEMLEKSSETIQQVDHEIEKLENLSLSVVDHFIRDEVPHKQPLNELVDFCGGSTPSKKNKDFWADKGICWFTSKDLKFDELVDSLDHITEKAINETALKPASSKKSVAISLRGMSLAHRIPMSILPGNSCINQDLKALIPKENVDIYVLFALLKREEKFLLTKVSSSAHGTRKLDFSHIRALNVPKLEADQLFRIKKNLQEIQQLKSHLIQKLILLQELQRSLSVRAFAGQL
jgi:type-1 restriction enzyme ecoR124II specificity protein